MATHEPSSAPSAGGSEAPSRRPEAPSGETLLDGRVALVSGVGPNLGRAAALRLAGAGADLVVTARRSEPLEVLAGEIEDLGRLCLAVPVDVTRPEDRHRLAGEVVREFGRLDVVVNNAFAEEDWSTFTEFDLDRWRQPFDVNVFGTLGLTQELLGLLRASPAASVVCVNTLSTRIVNPVLGGYASSKAALMTAVQVMAAELGPDGIRVNCIAPGHMMGDALWGYFEYLGASRGVSPGVIEGEISAQCALGRIPTGAEVAGAIVFLASDLARMITGETLDVNAGRYMH